MNKKKITLAFIALAAVFILANRLSKKQQPPSQATSPTVFDVTTQSAQDSATLTQTIQYPATIVGDQEIKVTAKSTGNASLVPFNLGDRVNVGSLLVRIDDTGNTLGIGGDGLQSSQVQQSGLSVDQAAEALSLAKKTYHDLKQTFDDQKNSPAQTVTKIQVDSAKKQVDIAETQYESTKIGFKSTLDNHLVTSPIAGLITNKSVSTGDSVSMGQPLFTVSKTTNVKIQFYVDQDQRDAITKGLAVNVNDNNGNTLVALVRNISPAADPITKRFLIEAFPKQQSPSLLSGTLTTVSFPVVKKPQHDGDLILPLSTITIGQNESYIFITDNGIAKKVSASVDAVDGETAEVNAAVAKDAQIIMNGSKLVQDGANINITK